MTPHITTTYIPFGPPIYRKVGGLHWFRFGRLRIALCWTRR